MTRNRSLVRLVGLVVVLLLAVLAVRDARSSGVGAQARAKLTLIAPAAAGGGWDLVARESQQAMRTEGLVNNVQVVNVPGAGGTIGLSQLVRMRGQSTTMMVTGTVMLGGITRGKAGTTLADTTPIARLAEDFEVIAVPKDSPHRDLAAMLKAWRANPTGTPIGGGSAGGIDHLVAAQLARVAGVEPSALKYTPHAGGGELTISLLSTAAGTVKVGISGYNDFRDLIENGQLRALAVVAPQRLEGLDVPTMKELGHPEVDLVNWRGYVAPPGITEQERSELVEIVQEMVRTPHWAQTVKRNRWQENFLVGPQYVDFLKSEQARINALLKELRLV